MIRKILKFILVIQEKGYKDPLKVGYTKLRINPFNPLSYLVIPIVILVGVVMFGIVGFWKETDLRNPFKYR